MTESALWMKGEALFVMKLSLERRKVWQARQTEQLHLPEEFSCSSGEHLNALPQLLNWYEHMLHSCATEKQSGSHGLFMRMCCSRGSFQIRFSFWFPMCFRYGLPLAIGSAFRKMCKVGRGRERGHCRWCVPDWSCSIPLVLWRNQYL